MTKKVNIMQDKGQHNHKGQPHGYWEKFYSNGNVWFKRNFINGKNFGLYEIYNNKGILIDKSRYYAR
jgi:antitoxin component YwqK of YwqJK toxin-antitoxin module